MSGSKFSTSRGRVIYVGDFLREFGPDALRYFIAVAGPETTDTDFTWDEFVRRTNFELANEWGNLVNRSISMAHKNNGSIPTPGTLAEIDQELLVRSRGPPSARSASCSVGTGSSWRSPRRCGWPGRPTSTSPTPSRGSSATIPARRDTVLHTALQVVSDVNTLLTPFLPHAAQKVHERPRRQGVWAAQPEIREVSEEGGPDYPVIMGDVRRRAGPLGVPADHARAPRWSSRPRCSPSSTRDWVRPARPGRRSS